MTTIKDALEIALNDKEKDKSKLGALLSSNSFDFFCIFIEYFAIRAKYKITREKNAVSLSHLLRFNSCDLIIKTELQPKKQLFFCFVYINDLLAVSFFEHDNTFKIKYTKYDKEDILKALQ